ncbi:MAG: hypothetical protein MJ175_03290 [Clostridia bacterium]|nr:hypothetical protein [Clostridia bacterium]
MKYQTRIAGGILLAAMLLASVSCGEASGTETPKTTAAVPGATEAVTEPIDPALLDNLPDTDLEGYNFRILSFTELSNAAIYVSDQDGSIVNDAVYDKVRTVEERFNCKISMADGSTNITNSSTGDEQSAITNAIMAGDDVFDIASAHDITTANMTLQGYFMNLYDVPHLNFEKPWWPSYTIESLTFQDQMYMFSNFISYYNMSDTRVMFFNKTLMSNLDIEYPYQKVRDKKWTLDYMAEIIKGTYSDINGDGKRDAADRYGIVNPNYYYCVLEPFNLEPYQKGKDGSLNYVFDLEKYQTVVEKLYALLFGGDGLVTTAGEVSEEIFTNGGAVFNYAKLSFAATKLSQSELIYGILPMPMLDEAQDEYYAGCTDRPFTIPITAYDHIDQTGLIIEAMSAEGYKRVFPAYFEQALKTRYADQTDDAEMIDIVMNNVILSFTYMYGDFSSPYNTMLETLFKPAKPSTDVASYAAKNEKLQIKRVGKIQDAYSDMATK